MRKWTFIPLHSWVQKISTTNYKIEKSGKSGPPLIKPEGRDCSEKRTAFATSSKTVSTKTVALPGLNVKAGTSAETTAKPGSSKATTTAAPGAKPTNQRQKTKGEAKSVVAGAVPKEWPTLRVEEPSKAKYAERKRAAYILRRAHLHPPNKEELTKDLKETLECAKAVLPNFSIEPPAGTKTAEEAKPSAKRPKIKETPNRSFADVARNRIIIGVLDEGDPEFPEPN
ncbi:uncharacterized protein LOC128920143 [Zeugodacus cucurbitae]|uniref:uncharacterized protein LOC128920143 n=1 Tax=Zeugodacus cucurbitae TaxID=28588 RepID=UPI0023D96EA3|nr:uncharacterized protein LOC128920143 [Zeugodacus cucurbitae]